MISVHLQKIAESLDNMHRGSEAFMIDSSVERELKYYEDVNYMLI